MIAENVEIDFCGWCMSATLYQSNQNWRLTISVYFVTNHKQLEQKQKQVLWVKTMLQRLRTSRLTSPSLAASSTSRLDRLRMSMACCMSGVGSWARLSVTWPCSTSDNCWRSCSIWRSYAADLCQWNHHCHCHHHHHHHHHYGLTVTNMNAVW